MKKLILILIPFLTITCNKVKRETISGKVVNIQNGETVSNYNVMIKYYRTSEQYPFEYNVAITDNDGNFTFSNVELNQSDKYAYGLSVFDIICASKGCPMPKESNVGINKNGNYNNYILKIQPRFRNLYVKLDTNTPLISPDNVSIVIKNKYDSQLSYTMTSNCLQNNNSCNLSLGPTGRWYINCQKVKNNITTNFSDSLDLNHEQTLTYTVDY